MTGQREPVYYDGAVKDGPVTFPVPVELLSAGLPPRALHVLLVLMSYRENRHDQDNYGQCNPSVVTIAKRCGCNRQTVTETLRFLRTRGFLEQFRKNSPTRYRPIVQPA